MIGPEQFPRRGDAAHFRIVAGKGGGRQQEAEQGEAGDYFHGFFLWLR